jgi:hypothetical protein
MLTGFTPVPETVTIAWRVVLAVFTAAVKVSAPLLLPEVGETVNQLWSDAAVQAVFDVTVTEAALPAGAAMFTLLLETASVCVAVAAACVTVIVTGVTPVPETVTNAWRVVLAVFTAAVKVSAPLLLPEVGETVNQLWFDAAVQAVFDVTVTEAVLPAGAAMFTLLLETASVYVILAAACVTVIVTGVTPVPETVTVAWRVVLAVFTAAVKVSVPLLLPDAGETVSQLWFDAAVQAVFDVTVTEAALPAGGAMFTLLLETARV